MMILWWEHSEKGAKGTDRQTDRQTGRQTDIRTDRHRQTDKQTDRKTVLFFKGKSIWKCYLQNVGHFFSGLNIGSFDAYLYQGVSSTKAKKRNSAYFKISEQNPVSVKKNYLIHSQLHRSACRIPNESQGCARQFLWFHIKSLHNVGANQVHQFAICTICKIFFKISYNSISKPCVEQKKRYSIKYFRNISWDIYMSIVSHNKIYPYFA